MQVLNCLIVEDEPLAAEIIRDYVSQIPALNLVGICEDAVIAFEKLRNEKIDLVFIDINLPKMSGIDFIKSVTSNPFFIITTAYPQFALTGYELNVIDYLVKPIEFRRFLQAVNKVLERKNQSASSLKEEKKFFYFNVAKQHIKVYSHDIVYIESIKDYVRIHLKEKSLVTKFQIGELEELLKESNFLRIHKSFIVNSFFVSSYNATEIELNNIKLKIGRTYKKSVQDTFIKKN